MTSSSVSAEEWESGVKDSLVPAELGVNSEYVESGVIVLFDSVSGLVSSETVA